MKDSNQELFIYHLVLTPEYENPEKWTEETYATIQEHSTFLEDLGKTGILVFAGRTKLNPGDENLFGIAVIRASSLEDAQKIMAQDPAVINSIQKASIYPFSMGIRHFANLK
ncbi:MAG: YciI family protein [Cyclobacteriaceae bacterium]